MKQLLTSNLLPPKSKYTCTCFSHNLTSSMEVDDDHHDQMILINIKQCLFFILHACSASCLLALIGALLLLDLFPFFCVPCYDLLVPLGFRLFLLCDCWVFFCNCWVFVCWVSLFEQALHQWWGCRPWTDPNQRQWRPLLLLASLCKILLPLLPLQKTAAFGASHTCTRLAKHMQDVT